MAGTLGNGVWTAAITEPGGRMVWASTAAAVRDFSMNRTQSEMSEATLEVVASGSTGAVEPWLHALTLFCDDEPAWTGIVTQARSTRGGLHVEAADGAAYWKRRRVPSARRFDQVDAAHIMAQMVVDAMALADPLQVADTLIEYPSRVWSVVDVSANSMMVAEVIDDLVDAGLQWTFHAGRLLIGPGPERHTTATLTDRHLGDGISITKDGRDVATDVLVIGKGVWGQASLQQDRVGVQAIVKADSLTTVQECEELAKRELVQRGVAPRTLTLPSGVSLAADAPVTLPELIPGVRVPVSSSQTGTTLGADLVLESVEVAGDSGGADVSISLGTPGITYSEREATPPPLAFDHRSPWEKEQQDKVQNAAQKKEADWAEPGVPL